MPDALLAPKLYRPPPRAQHVPRPRLVARLQPSAGQPALILLSAPPGFGKTSLLAEWLAAPPAPPAAWLTLDEDDNDPARLLAYLLAALQTLVPEAELFVAAQGLLRAPGPPPAPKAVLAAAVNDLAALPAGWRLVLDDYHVLTEPALHEAIAFLVEHLPPGASLVIASRADPPLPLPRLRARQQLLALGAAELRFAPEETAQLLAAAGLDLDPAAVAALEARTEGWAAALQLASLALREAAALGQPASAGQLLGALSGTHRYVFDYLAEEILRRQPAPVRQFLLRTAVLERLSAAACAALLDPPAAPAEAQALLEQLERRNLLVVPLDAERRWYRYHGLFADFLRAQLDPGERAALHRRAADWHAAQGEGAEAVRHALATGDYAFAAAHIGRAGGPLLTTGGWTTLRGWLEALPPAIVAADPQLSLLLAWTLTLTGQLERVEPALAHVEPALAGASEGASAWRGQVAAIRGYSAALRGDVPAAVAHSQQALALLPAGNALMRGIIAMNLGAIYASTGLSDQAVAALDEARAASLAAGNMPTALSAAAMLAQLHEGQGRLRQAAAGYRALLEQAGPAPQVLVTAQMGLGQILYEWNQLDEAAAHLEAGLATAQRLGLPELAALAALRLAWLGHAQGDAAATQRHIAAAERDAGAAAQTILGGYVAAQRARLALARGEPGAAERWLAPRTPELAAPLNLDALPPQRVLQLLTDAWALTASGQSAAAVTLLEQLLPALAAHHLLPAQIEARLHLARATRDRAHAAAARALAGDEGYTRVFLDLGADDGRPRWETRGRPTTDDGRLPTHGLSNIQPVEAPTHPALRVPSTSTPPHLHTPTLPEPLTPRELDVLRLLAAGASNRAMAEQLVVSLGTVKKHLNNIFGKLDAANRTQAVARARELGLL